jgi:hypothetical protein
MLSDDAFRAQLRRVLEQIRTWARNLGDAAHIEETETSTYWRMGVMPTADNTCPFELIAHFDQKFDLTVAAETYEACKLPEPRLLADIVTSIGDGRAITRLYHSRNTGMLRSVETIIQLSEDKDWRRMRLNGPFASAIAVEDCEATDKVYAPYRLEPTPNDR